MEQLRRRSRVVKWAGVGVSLFIAIAWASSLVLKIHYQHASQTWEATLWRGMVMASSTCPWANGWLISVAPVKPVWSGPRRSYVRDDPNGGGLPAWSPVHFNYIRLRSLNWWLYLPLWLPFLLAATPTAILFWLDRRRMRPHCCQCCGYDLTGNTSGICPECGVKT